MDHLDLLINNAVTVSPDCDKGFFEADLDYIAKTVDVAVKEWRDKGFTVE